MDSIVVANIFYYLLTKYETIIFTETTEDYTENRYGLLYLPKSITIEQYKITEGLIGYFEQFSSILLQGGLISDGIRVVDAELSKELNQAKIKTLRKYLKPLIKTEEN